jgi:predicted metal-dependent phosphoesterase TrpH
MRDAFDRWLGTGRPGFVSRVGPRPEAVIATVHAAGGLISLAHPGRTQIDEHIAALQAAGLDALEVYHSDHDEATVQRYAALVAQSGLLATGGSDFHADPSSSVQPGSVTLPRHLWERLLAARSSVT